MLEFRILGPLDVRRDGRRIRPGGPRQHKILLMLLLEPGRVVSIEALIEAVWDGNEPSTARKQVQNGVADLRRALASAGEEDRIVTDGPGYLLRLDDDAQLDWQRFEHRVAEAGTLAGEGRLDRAVEALRAALALWRGPALGGPAGGPLTSAAARMDEQRLAAMEQCWEHRLALGEHRELVGELTAHVAEHPFREHGVGQLMRALHQGGRTPEALGVYAAAQRRLAEEMGLEPGAGLRRLQMDMLQAGGDQVPTRADPAGYTCRHPPPVQLPARIPDLAGRGELIERVVTALRTADAATSPRVVITGPGGIGKTAFTVRLAHELRRDYPDGILCARLSPSSRSEALLGRFLEAFGVPPQALPDSIDDRVDMFRGILTGRRVLVIIDNAQQENQIGALLPERPGCAVLITSRRRLAGTDAWLSLQMPPLPEAGAVELLREAAGERQDLAAARQIARYCGGFPLAVRIAAARLATRPNWTLADLADRLGDAKTRLDWLRLGDAAVRTGILDSYSDLTGDQQRLFRWLGFLRINPFPSWVATALIGPGAELVLDELVEAHLVEPAGRDATGPRYRMHDLVLLCASELAAQGGDAGQRDAAVRRATHGWFALAAAADDGLAHWVGVDPAPEPGWRPPDAIVERVRDRPVQWFDEERETLVSLVRRAADAGGDPHGDSSGCSGADPDGDSSGDSGGDAGLAWPLAQRLSNILELQGRHDERVAVLSSGLRAAELLGDDQGRATMLGLLMLVESDRDDYLAALGYGERALKAYRLAAEPGSDPSPAPVSQPEPHQGTDGDWLSVGLVTARRILTWRHQHREGDYLSLFERARDAFRASRTPLLEAWALRCTGLIYCRQERFAEAEVCLERVRAILLAVGEHAHLAHAGGDLAGFSAAQGRWAEAEAIAAEAIEQAHVHSDPWGLGRALITMGEVFRARGAAASAADAYRQALAIWQSLRIPARETQARQALADLMEAEPASRR
ncbi:NB-ARC domain-containing protein [Nonomuraea sp. NBC_00507]|uniref:AfsR/SARP family transcriptional regulator n=1 Tax=Nonomuraea sp. NBC_00507 TaxID=2976002 RepID=UPI002E18C240